MAKRVSIHWGGPNPRVNITEFNQDEINKDNLVNQILLVKQSDISSSLIMKLFGSFDGKTFVHHYDTFEVPAGGFKFTNDKGKEVSNTKPFITTFGIWLFNIFFFRDFGFSNIVGGYINKNLTKGDFSDYHQTILYALLEDKIEVEQYKNFIQYADFVMPWETILSPAQSEELLSCTKEVNKLKAKLIKENKAELDAGNAVVAEKIEKQLIDFAKEYLKDDPAMDCYLSGAGGSIPNNFKNMYLMKGAIRNPDPNAKQEFDIAINSFSDGITNAKEYSLLARSLSRGPYSRAKKTEIGGYWEKLIEAATNTISISGVGTDCGSKRYIETVLTKGLKTSFMYNYIIKNDGSIEELTSSNIDNYINKKIKVRSAMFCKEFAKTGKLCNICAGNFFMRRGNPNIGLACSGIATKCKLISMKSFHDSTVKTTEIDPMKVFSLK